MTKSEWLDHWLSRAPVLPDEALDDIRHILTIGGEDED